MELGGEGFRVPNIRGWEGGYLHFEISRITLDMVTFKHDEVKIPGLTFHLDDDFRVVTKGPNSAVSVVFPILEKHMKEIFVRWKNIVKEREDTTILDIIIDRIKFKLEERKLALIQVMRENLDARARYPFREDESQPFNRQIAELAGLREPRREFHLGGGRKNIFK